MSTKKKVLLTGARAPVTLDLARLLSTDGHHVLVADTSKYHLCHYSRAIKKSLVVPAPNDDHKYFINAIIDLIKLHKVDILIPTCEEIFSLAAHHTKISSYCELLCTTLPNLDTLHNKNNFIQLLKKKGLPYPETHLLTSKKQLRLASLMWEKVVYKPVYSRFAQDVIICDKGSLENTASIVPTKNEPWIAQEFIEGQRLCSYGCAKNGQLLAHVTYPAEYCIGETGPALLFQSRNHPKLLQLMQALVKSLSFTGQFSLDLIEKENDQLIPIECNPRATSGLHLFKNSDNLPSSLIKGNQIPPLPEGRKAHFTLPLFWKMKSQPVKLMQTLFTSRDALFCWWDPLPALISPALLVYYYWQAYKKNMSLIELSTHDIKWNGESCESQ